MMTARAVVKLALPGKIEEKRREADGFAGLVIPNGRGLEGQVKQKTNHKTDK